MTRRVRIEKLAPTGEGIARTADGVGFVDRALPGELVETNVYEVRNRFWRGALREVLEPSPHRVSTAHASCGGCDWSHFDADAAREAKRELFLETMRRIGRLEPGLFGELPAAASPSAYRLRLRLHVAGRGAATEIGYHGPRSHRVVSAADCEALSPGMRASVPRVREAIAASGAAASEVAFLEDIAGQNRLVRVRVDRAGPADALLAERLAASFTGVRVAGEDGAPPIELGARALDLDVRGRAFSVSVDTFFQSNRHLVGELFGKIESEGRRVEPGGALDAFGGAGLFAGALLSAGHRVTSVEADVAAAADARRTRDLWPDRDRWEIVASDVGRFLEDEARSFACVVADPPRGGLGKTLAASLAKAAGRRLILVSCDPATLARDLPVVLAEGFAIRDADLYDLFAFTHRVEAVVALERVA